MKGILSKILPFGASIPDINEDQTEYSIAMEYNGPPVAYDLPRAIPVDTKWIPSASLFVPTSLSGELSLPIIQPLTVKKHSKDPTLGSDSVVSPTSVIAFESRAQDGHNCGLSDEISSSPNDHDQSSKVSDVNDSSLELSSRIGNAHTLEFSNSSDESHKLSNKMRSPVESEISSESLSNESSSFKAEDDNNVPPTHARRPSVVTFCDAESSYSGDEEFISDENESTNESKEPVAKVKKGLCYKCFKGNRFTEKEACIVCNAKYCSNCVLSAMGSMPEGRKCVDCVGNPIDESKRGSLGKCSRMLKRLLSDLETQQLMRVEKLCEANQLHAEQISVNGRKLCQEELILLQSCPKPPTKLQPGRYWYDKISGLWGKEGQKPCKIISPHMNVGGVIMPKASNGNTKVFINYREITKEELRMLKWAGVHCDGNPHFWVDEHGKCQEEGQKKEKGKLWNTFGTKLVCAFLSLPIPSKDANPCAEEVNNIVNRVVPDYLKQRKLQKLLLVGYDGSGTSTIFKQAKILYNAEPFSEDERQDIKLMILSNVYSYLGILLEGRERFEEESLNEKRKKLSLDQLDGVGRDVEGDDTSIYSIGLKLKAFSDWLLKVMVSGNLDAIFPAASREYAPLVEELWNDAAIQATFERRSELQMLPSVASHFLKRVVDISSADYEPSNVDILYANGITSSNGIASMDFSFPQSAPQGLGDTAERHDPLLRYQLIRVHPRGLGEHCKWLDMFEDVQMVIYCVALSDYDQFCDDGSTNKMLASRKLFQDIITHPSFEQKQFLLILNKFDLLEEKIEQVPLSQCNWFDDFNPVISRHRSKLNNNINTVASLAEQAFHYIAVKFKTLFYDLTEHRLFVSLVKGLEPDMVNEALKYGREILKWDEETRNINPNDISIFSTEVSSLST